MYGPRIVTDGLVLLLDTGNSKSYPGSGNIWYDLSGNEFHGVSSTNTAYVQYDTNQSSWEFKGGEVDGHGIFIQDLNYVTGETDQLHELTIDTFIKVRSGASGNSNDQRIILSFDRSSVFRYAIGNDIISGIEGKPSFMFTNSDGIFDRYASSFTGDLRDDKWHQISITFKSGLGNGIRYYLDGTLISSDTTNYGPISNQNTSETPRFGVIGAGSEKTTDSVGSPTLPYDIFDGHISIIRYYNKALTLQEIQQNYLATKGRFIL